MDISRRVHPPWYCMPVLQVVEHLASIQGSVQTLGQLEWEAQSSFLALKSRWAASHVPPAPGVVGGAQGKSL
jgi:hypothetical protein